MSTATSQLEERISADCLVDPALLRPLGRDEVRFVNISKAGLLLDELMIHSARGGALLDLAVGERLLELQQGQGYVELGFSSLDDYAVELLGISARQSQLLTRMARRLRELPRLRVAVVQGELSARKLEVLLPVVDAENEAQWLARAQQQTVRRLVEQVRRARAAAQPGGGSASGGTAEVEPAAEAGAEPAAEPEHGASSEPWTELAVAVTPALAARWEAALERAALVCGFGASPAARIEAVASEYLGQALPALGEVDAQAVEALLAEVDARQEGRSRGDAAQADELRAFLEQRSRDWADLPQGTPPLAGVDWSGARPRSPRALHEELTRLHRLRQRLRADLGRLARLFRLLGGWRVAGFASLAHYAQERLGMHGRTLLGHVRIDARLVQAPEVLARYQDGRLGEEKVRLLLRLPVREPVLVAWAERAQQTTCRALRELVGSALRAQERGEIEEIGPPAPLESGDEGGDGGETEAGAGPVAGAGADTMCAGGAPGPGELSTGCADGDGRESPSFGFGWVPVSVPAPPGTGAEAGPHHSRTATPAPRGANAGPAAKRPLSGESSTGCADGDGPKLGFGWVPASVPAPPGTGTEAGPHHSRTAPAHRPPRRYRVGAPRPVIALLRAALEAALRLHPDVSSPTLPCSAQLGAALGLVAEHFLAAWPQPDPATLTLPQQVVLRDRGRCTVPGCTSRLALQAHHIVFRGHGGSDALSNLTTLCLVHHLQGVHGGWLRIEGQAPDRLRFSLGVGGAGPALVRYRGEVVEGPAGTAAEDGHG